MLRGTPATIVVLTAIALSGCSGAVGSGADDVSEAGLARARSDAKTVATQMESYFVEHGTYPTSPSELPPQQTTTDLRSIDATATGYKLCVVDSATGAWAVYDSTAGGLGPSGTSGGDCSG